MREVEPGVSSTSNFLLPTSLLPSCSLGRRCVSPPCEYLPGRSLWVHSNELLDSFPELCLSLTLCNVTPQTEYVFDDHFITADPDAEDLD